MCDGMNPTTNLLDGAKNYRDPSISPEGTRDTVPLDAEVAARATSNWWTSGRISFMTPPLKPITEWAAEHAPWPLGRDHVHGKYGLGPNSPTVLGSMQTCFSSIPAGTSRRTLQVADEVEKRYPDLPLVRVLPLLTPEEQDEVYGPRLYARDTAAYNRMRKVEPLNMTMDPYAGWVTGPAPRRFRTPRPSPRR